MPFSVNNLLNDANVVLQKEATNKFGTVVDDFTNKSVKAITEAVSTNTTQITEGPLDTRRFPAQVSPAGGQVKSAYKQGVWNATSYAAGLAGSSDFRPKLKFLFKVEFIFTQAAIAMFPDLASPAGNEFTFMIKSVDRPKIDFEYDEDVNMYNFRTKVLKRIKHRELTIIIMDDVGNRVFDFFRKLMMIHSPITRRQIDRDGSLKKPSAMSIVNGSGMTFGPNGPDSKGLGDNSHRAVVNSAFGNSIESIRVMQIFVDPSPADIALATKMVSFDFMNPRIMSFDLDDLSHETNDVNLLTMVFDYDWMEMVKVGSLGTPTTEFGEGQKQNVSAPSVGAPWDISSNKSKSAAASGQGANNGLMSSLSKIAGNNITQLTTDIISKSIKTSAGGGKFATAIGGIVTNTVGGPISGLVSGASRDLLLKAQSAGSQIYSRATAPIAVDSAAGGSAKITSTVSSSSAYSSIGPIPSGGGE